MYLLIMIIIVLNETMIYNEKYISDSFILIIIFISWIH